MKSLWKTICLGTGLCLLMSDLALAGITSSREYENSQSFKDAKKVRAEPAQWEILATEYQGLSSDHPEDAGKRIEILYRAFESLDTFALFLNSLENEWLVPSDFTTAPSFLPKMLGIQDLPIDRLGRLERYDGAFAYEIPSSRHSLLEHITYHFGRVSYDQGGTCNLNPKMPVPSEEKQEQLVAAFKKIVELGIDLQGTMKNLDGSDNKSKRLERYRDGFNSGRQIVLRAKTPLELASDTGSDELVQFVKEKLRQQDQVDLTADS